MTGLWGRWPIWGMMSRIKRSATSCNATVYRPHQSVSELQRGRNSFGLTWRCWQGHFFFNKPLGRGYDDGLIFALAVCDMLDRNPGKSMADLKNALPKTWGSPTMAPHCADETKYAVVDEVVGHFQMALAKGEMVAGQPIRNLVTVNGVRVTVEDGTWGLVRASSNKPELVVVVESPVSETRMRDMFKAVDAVLREHPEVGEYNQTI